MFKESILKLSKQLYPKGRAFRIPFASDIEKIHEGLAISENDAFASAIGILDSILPDNNNFTDEDATTWERRLGLITNETTTLNERKLAIQRKMNHPGTIKARQHYLYLERELRNAGFDVYVHENRIVPGLIPVQFGVSEFGNTELGGETEHPEDLIVVDPNDYPGFTIAANHIDESLDANFFDVQPLFHQFGLSEFGNTELGAQFELATWEEKLRSTFFVGDQTFGDFANVSTARKDEFRQLILKIKPVPTVGFLLVNYV